MAQLGSSHHMLSYNLRFLMGHLIPFEVPYWSRLQLVCGQVGATPLGNDSFKDPSTLYEGYMIWGMIAAWLFILLPKWVVQLCKEFLDHFHPQIQVVKKLQVPSSVPFGTFSRGVSGPLGPNKFCHFDLLADNLVLKCLGPLPRIIPGLGDVVS